MSENNSQNYFSTMQQHWDQIYGTKHETQLGWYETDFKTTLAMIEKAKEQEHDDKNYNESEINVDGKFFGNINHNTNGRRAMVEPLVIYIPGCGQTKIVFDLHQMLFQPSTKQKTMSSIQYVLSDISSTAVEKSKQAYAPFLLAHGEKKGEEERGVSMAWFVTDIASIPAPTPLQSTSSSGAPKAPNVNLWLDRATLHFLQEKSQIDAYFKNVQDCVKEGGYVLLEEFSKEGGAMMCAGLSVHPYDITEYSMRLGGSFQLIAQSQVPYFTPAGVEKPYVFGLFQKKNKNTSKEEGDEASFSHSQQFDPTSIGLSKDFVLTDFTRLKGCSCKLPQPQLLRLLRAVGSPVADQLQTSSTTCEGKCETCGDGTDEVVGMRPKAGSVGMDCSIVPLPSHYGIITNEEDENNKTKKKNQQRQQLFLVSTTDYFFPSVEDPYLQGQIGCANVLSDMYAMGITRCDTMLMLLAASSDMDENEKYITSLHMMKGFAERAKLADTAVTGGQTVLNPWPLIGGVAMTVVSEGEMIRPTNLQPGDVLVLTKPLGHQIAVNLKQWLKRPSPLFNNFIAGKMSSAEIEELYQSAAQNMKRLNLEAAELMVNLGAHGATDITGFGILGHSINFSECQPQRSKTKENQQQQSENTCVQIEIHTLPILKGAIKGSELMKDKYRLFQGYSAETSGGLLIALPSQEVAERFVEEFRKTGGGEKKSPPSNATGMESWIVGRVLEKNVADNEPYAYLSKNVNILPI